MNIRALRNTNVIGGLLAIALGVGVLMESDGYDRGAIFRMGPGYFPTLLGALLFILGAVLAIRGCWESGDAFAPIHARPIFFIAAGVILFAVTLLRFGLVPASVLLIGVSSLASPLWRPKAILCLAVGITLFAYIVFVRTLSMNLAFIRW